VASPLTIRPDRESSESFKKTRVDLITVLKWSGIDFCAISSESPSG
jgi:hypothetical protein